MLLSETALRDLNVIPDTFPLLGQFGGTVEEDDGTCRFSTRGQYLPEQSHLPLHIFSVATGVGIPTFSRYTDNLANQWGIW